MPSISQNFVTVRNEVPCAEILEIFFSFSEDVEKKKYLTGSVVSPTTPKEKDDIYWGYSVRLANSFSAVFTESPYKSGYDLTMGTSERGEVLDQMDLPNFK